MANVMERIAARTVSGLAEKQMKIMQQNFESINNNYAEIVDQNRQILLALITLYNNQVVLAKKLDVKLPDPLVKMNLE